MVNVTFESPLVSTTPTFTGGSSDAPEVDYETISRDDAVWALANSFMILTMQTGFGLLECGCVSTKNVSNIMVKNVVDVSLGGVAYWMFGYALSFGKPANPFMGLGYFFLHVPTEANEGSIYTHYAFQFSFATTATTIVSGAVAERMRLDAYVLFSFLNTIVYCIPASWAWNDVGFLRTRGFYDFAGAAVVHFNGGVSALVAALMMGPRVNRWSNPETFEMSSPVTVLTGMFMLCWAWLAFNCGSTFGVSGKLWKVAAKVSVTTLNGSIGGGCAALLLTYIITRRHYDIGHIVNGVLGGLVAITSICSIATPSECLLIGAIGGSIAVLSTPLVVRLKIDDPVGAIPVHGFAAIWATLAVGLMGKNDSLDQLAGHNGLLHGGGMYLLGIQLLGLLCIGCWSALTTFLCLLVIDKTLGIRVTREEELLGADLTEHGIRGENVVEQLQMSLTTGLDKQKLRDIFEEMLTAIFDQKAIDGGRHAYAHHLFPSRIAQQHSRTEEIQAESTTTRRLLVFPPSGQLQIVQPTGPSRVAWDSADTNAPANSLSSLTLWQQLKKKENRREKPQEFATVAAENPLPSGPQREILRKRSESASNSSRWTLTESPDCFIPVSPPFSR